jgi:hypothetical protein
MKIRELLFASIASLLMFMFCAPLCCQDDYDAVPGTTIGGRVVSVDSQKSQIVVKSSGVMTFLVPQNANIINDDGFSMQLSDVEAGHYVDVDYHDDPSGNHIMESMEVEYNR